MSKPRQRDVPLPSNKADVQGGRAADVRIPAMASGIRWIALFAVSLYVMFRLFSLDLTSDEWGGLKNIYCKSIADLVSFKYVDAQSHFFQSLLSILCWQAFPETWEGVTIRLPCLLGLAAYVYAAFRITSLVKHGALVVIGFLALCTNAFLLDYLGLARGYGLALGFLLLSLWHVVNVYLDPGAARHFHLALWCGCLAVLCNLAWLSYYIAIAAVLLWRAYTSQADAGLARRLGRTLVDGQCVIYNALLVCVFYLPRVILLMERGGLYFGGSEGFVKDTVQSLVKGVLYVKNEQQGVQYEWLAYVAFVLCGLASCVSLYRLWRDRQVKREPAVTASGILAAILLLSAIAVEVFHVLFNVKYIIERAATGFLVVSVCQLVLFAASIDGWRRKTVLALLIVVTVAGASNLNISRTYVREASQMREFVRWIGEVRKKEGRHLIIGTDSGCNYTIWYYLETLLRLQESAQTKDGIGFVRIFNGVTIYSVELPENKGLFDDNTDYLLLKHRVRQGRYPQPLKLVREFRNAELDLFACGNPGVSRQESSSGFNGKIYPMRFDRVGEW